MSLFTQEFLASRPAPRIARHWPRDLLATLAALTEEWEVKRQMARAQRLDSAFLRDIGVAAGGLESAIRHGRKAPG